MSETRNKTAKVLWFDSYCGVIEDTICGKLLMQGGKEEDVP